jgi:hypothetical protein
MTQTAVEWLAEQLEGDDSKIARVIGLKKYNSIIKKANKMFEEQIIQAAQYEPFLGDLPRTEGEHYFEKTFKK